MAVWGADFLCDCLGRENINIAEHMPVVIVPVEILDGFTASQGAL
jgi:hypothetical protein